MSVLRAFPYRTVDDALSVRASSDDDELELRSDGAWDAYSSSGAEVRMQVDIDIDIDRVVRGLPAGEDPEVTLAGLVQLRSKTARRREVLHAFPVRAGRVVLPVVLRRDHHAGKVEVEVLLVRAGRRKEEPGFANHVAAVLARHSAAVLLFDEPPAPSGSSIEIRWADFTESPSLPDGNLFALRMADRPTILLNTAVPFSYQILSSKGTHGAAARIRDATYAQITHQVWTSLLGHCFMSVIRVAHEDPETTLERLADWEAQVVQDWAPDLYPAEADRAGAVRRLVDELQVSGNTVLVERVADVIQSRLLTGRGFGGLVRESDRFGAEVPE